MQPAYTTARTQGSAIETNKVLRNTYGLLSMTLIFSAIMAVVSMKMNFPYLGLWTLAGYFGLLFLTSALRNSVWGIASVFALTGFMGLTIGPILNFYIGALSNGGQLIAFALGGTGVIFLTMSGIALTTKRDFSWMGKFLTIGIVVAFLAGLGAVRASGPSCCPNRRLTCYRLTCCRLIRRTAGCRSGCCSGSCCRARYSPCRPRRWISPRP